MTQEAEILERAAEALESGRIRWGKYQPATLIKPAGTWCAAETIDIVAREMGLRSFKSSWTVCLGDSGDRADEAVSRHVTKGRDGNHLTAWNDAPGRTLDEVVQAFKETAKELRNRAHESGARVVEQDRELLGRLA